MIETGAGPIIQAAACDEFILQRRPFDVAKEELSFALRRLQFSARVAQPLRNAEPPAHFRLCSGATVLRELKEIEDRTEKFADKMARRGRDRLARDQLARLLRGLHSPTIAALDDAPVFIIRGSPRLPLFSDMLRELPDRLEWGLGVPVADMRLLGAMAKHARAQAAQRDYLAVGRPPNRQAHIIARDLARAYRDLTGRDPTATTIAYGDREGKATGYYVRFVERIFGALGIERAAWSDALRAGHQQRGGRGRKK